MGIELRHGANARLQPPPRRSGAPRSARARVSLGEQETVVGVLMAKLVRGDGACSKTALGDFTDAKTVRGTVEPAAQVV